MATVTSSTSASATAALATTTSGTTTTTSVDWDALIEAQVATKTAAADTIETSITANEAKISAYQNLQTLLDTLVTSTTSLSKSIVNSLSDSTFGARAATITSSGDVSASSAVSMSISNGAATGDHTLTVEQIATAHRVIGTSVADKSADMGLTGVFSLGLAGGTSVDVSITSGMSMEDIADTINAQSDSTNVQASIIQISSTEYALTLTALNDNAEITTSVVSGDDVLTTLGVTDSAGDFTDVLQEPQPALFTVDGISLTRDTNDITDVLSGVTFSLLQATPDGSTINLSIDVDADQIAAALEEFVTAYNAVREEVTAQQTLTSDGTADSSAVLFGDGTMRSIMTQIEQAMNSTVGGLSMTDLGLSFTDTNTLEFDTSVLSATLTEDLSGVIALLASKTTASSSSLSVVNTNSSPPSSFVLDIAVDDSGALTVSVGGDSSLFTVSGNTIIGASGTVYSGMAFTYSGSSSASITVTSTSGIAAQINNIADLASDTSTGSLQDLVTSLQSQDDRMEQQINDINERAEIYRAMLVSQYAKYQSAISTADTTLDYLSALLNDE
ncbi:Flagellar hook-associated protein [Rhodopseudomonas palustris HaA2]|uniref:Flagellar hook-associated protein 2 n=1 Tax=Rhodopseudomonas palustris (strain HaA2) TaxID=316058 RepID=Q2J238_RHOP2|nr:flagellar filament capping protein FliD [Rhodopseudomonas palustris]ABD05472.1 Flagellar hook-associated protein [Rhodopseudomonas palustris HaA2]